MNTIARTAAQVAELYPELAPGTAVIVHPNWSRDQADRPEWLRGAIARHTRNGYVRVVDSLGTGCDHDPRDLTVV